MAAAKRLLKYGKQTLRLQWMYLQYRWQSLLGLEPFHSFQCNLCGQSCHAPVSAIRSREGHSCYHCGSTLRFRTLIWALCHGLFGENIALSSVQERHDLRGLGMSDADLYAERLPKKFNYINSYYHQEPRFDITKFDPAHESTFDFVVSSDVFEHVAPPVEQAFENLYRILKPGGICVLTVPYVLQGETVEHFPELHDYRLEQRNGRFVLINRTADGRQQIFQDLVFHGGPGSTLEMRVFSLPNLKQTIRNSGFASVEVLNEEVPEFGILRENATGAPILLRK